MISILIIDDRRNACIGLLKSMSESYSISVAENIKKALFKLARYDFDIVLTDLRIAGRSGMEIIDFCMLKNNRPACIIMTAYGSVKIAVEAMRRGASNFMLKPIDLNTLDSTIRRSIRTDKYKNLFEKDHKQDDIIGESVILNEVLRQSKRAASSKATILINGETGTGKELIAKMIHRNSCFSNGPMITIHCAAIPENLLESELFGHEKGSFTGAVERRIGRFEAANNGTLFLDEIGEINKTTQMKLLRFLEYRTLERIGSQKQVKVNIRLVCATHRNLNSMVEMGEFREDLYYRLNVVPIQLPSLRERPGDIPLLIKHYLSQFAAINQTKSLSITSKALFLLKQYKWPGNIRELRNFCEKAVVMNIDKTISELDLELKFKNSSVLGINYPEGKKSILADNSMKVKFEQQYVLNTLIRTKGNRTHAAMILGISRRTLIRKIKQWPELDVKIKY